MNYLHMEANIDVKHSRCTEYDINDHLEYETYLKIGCFSSLTDAIMTGVVDDRLR